MADDDDPHWRTRARALEWYALAAILAGSLVYGILGGIESLLR